MISIHLKSVKLFTFPSGVKMVNVFQKKVLILALYAGEIMMKSGAEIYRVEDTITRICKACGISYVEVFATPTGIFVSLDKGAEDDDTQTYIKRIKGISTDLNKISQVNHFSRQFTTTDLSVEEGMKILKEIDKKSTYPLPVRILGAAIVASSFCLLCQGSFIDALVAVFSGAACYMFAVLLKLLDINSFVTGFCCCGLAAFIAMTAASSISNASYDPIIIGTLMIFVPGVALTNSIRDFLSGDMLSGVSRLIEAVLTALSLAAGAGVVLKLWDIIGGISL